MRFPVILLAAILSLFPLKKGLTEDWELRRDDLDKRLPKVEEGLIDLRIDEAPLPFPRYFNELGIKMIRIRFRAEPGERKMISFVWTGGSQDVDRFALSVDGIPAGLSRKVYSEERPHAWYRDDFFCRLGPGKEHVLEIVSPEGFESAINFAGFRMAAPDGEAYQPICYESIGSLKRYEESLGARGAMVDSPHLRVFAPYKHAAKARALAAFLETAYAEMVKIYGIHPIFKFSVEHYPEGHERGFGGISGAGTIGYPLEALDRFAGMKRDVRAFAGYTEEMSHGFKAYFRCSGTYEALGVAVQEEIVRRLVPERVADAFWNWRHDQCAETARAYLEAGCKNPDPGKYPWNVLFTRILNHLFLELRMEYGPEMWTDFFRVIRQMDYPLHRAKETERLRIYVRIFSVLFAREMEKTFEGYGIDLDADPPWGFETYKEKD